MPRGRTVDGPAGRGAGRARPRAARGHGAGRPRRRRGPHRPAGRRPSWAPRTRRTRRCAGGVGSRPTSRTRPAGETVLRLVERADVLLEGYRPGVTERLGVGPDACQARNPRLVYGRMTGWGQDGPLAERAGHDINYISLTGALHAIGRAGERAGATAEPGRRLRRRLDAAGGRGAGRAVGGADAPGRARSWTRPWSTGRACSPSSCGDCAGSSSGPTGRTATCSTGTRRSTTPTAARTAGTWRSGRWSRSSTRRC